jgi:hypothetical protein
MLGRQKAPKSIGPRPITTSVAGRDAGGPSALAVRSSELASKLAFQAPGFNSEHWFEKT